MKRFTARVDARGVTTIAGPKPIASDGLEILIRGYIANEEDIAAPAAEDKTEGETRIAACFARAYRRWGAELSRHVYGEYAVAVYDPAKRTCLLAHDALGIVPLYYQQRGPEIVLGTHLDDVVQHRGALELDEEYIADFLCHGDHFGERTPFSSIKQLRLETSVSCGPEGVRKHACGVFGSIETTRYSDIRDYADHLRALVTSGVRAALPQEGTVWCELSGGLDSSTVVCTAVGLRGAQNVKSISVVYPDSQANDESRWVDKVIEATGIESHRVNGDAAMPFSQLPDRFGDLPTHGYIHMARFRAYEALVVKNQVGLILTGHGGDAVLYGDGPGPFFLADLLCGGNFRTLAQGLRNWTNESPKRRPARYWLSQFAVRGAMRRATGQVVACDLMPAPWIHGEYRAAARLTGKRRKSWFGRGASVADACFLERLLRSANVVTTSENLAWLDVEYRCPLMYLPLVQFMRSIPWEMRTSPTWDRLLHREAMKGVLPDAVRLRRTKGGPTQAVFRGLASGAAWLRILCGKTLLEERGYVDGARWNEAVEMAKIGNCRNIKQFMAAATLEAWLRLYESGRGK
jgi:asparagine synthase (glutamine-hydrolysing)